MHVQNDMPRMLRTMVFLALLLIAAGAVHAQLNVDVFWNVQAPGDTVIDFGVTKEGFPVTRTLYVRNNSPETVGVFELVPKASDPYFVIYNDTARGIAANAKFKEEFRPVDRLPRYIRSGQTGTVVIQFRAIAQDSDLPPDSINQSMLDIRVADSAAVANEEPFPPPSRFARFTLRALKTTRILASTTPRITFDSVYVFPSPDARVRNYTLRNNIERPIPVEEQRLTMLSPIIDSAEISAATYTQVNFPPGDTVSWRIQYNPKDMGADSALFAISYKPEPTSKPDTIVANVVGIGVEQRLRIVQATGSPQSVRIANDTVDFGDVFVDGIGSKAVIIVGNSGNCNIGIVGEEQLGPSRDVEAFGVVRRLQESGPTLEVGRRDTIVVQFIPADSGAHSIRYVIRTDLRSRPIYGVPDGAQDVALVIKGKGLRAQIQVSPLSLEYGTIGLPDDCKPEVLRSVRLKNVGNTDLHIDTITGWVNAGSIAVSRKALTIPPAQLQTVDVTLQPSAIGQTDGALRMVIRGSRDAVVVPISASVVPPDTINVRLPEVVRARPGRIVSIPVAVNGRVAAKASQCVIRMTYDPTLLRFRDVVKLGTASEGAQERSAGETTPGTLLIDLVASTGFLERDTLLYCTFDTFLGKRASTELAITRQSVTFGDTMCPTAQVVQPQRGLFMLDSVCGLDYKTVTASMGLRASLFPNPSWSSVTLAVDVNGATDLAVRIVDARGMELSRHGVSVAHSGMQLVEIPLQHLDAGAYTVDILAGRRRVALPLMKLP